MCWCFSSKKKVGHAQNKTKPRVEVDPQQQNQNVPVTPNAADIQNTQNVSLPIEVPVSLPKQKQSTKESEDSPKQEESKPIQKIQKNSRNKSKPKSKPKQPKVQQISQQTQTSKINQVDAAGNPVLMDQTIKQLVDHAIPADVPIPFSEQEEKKRRDQQRDRLYTQEYQRLLRYWNITGQDNFEERRKQARQLRQKYYNTDHYERRLLQNKKNQLKTCTDPVRMKNIVQIQLPFYEKKLQEKINQRN